MSDVKPSLSVLPGGDDEPNLPPPPVPADCDIRSFAGMFMGVQRIRDSDFVTTAPAEAVRAALLAWCACWHQVPAASLPDDDVKLARLLGYGRDLAAWKEARLAGALHGFRKHSDGRLYHGLIADLANAAWAKKRVRTEAGKKGGRPRLAQSLAEQPESNCFPIANQKQTNCPSNGMELNGKDREMIQEDHLSSAAPATDARGDDLPDADAASPASTPTAEPVDQAHDTLPGIPPPEQRRKVSRTRAADISAEVLNAAAAIWNDVAAAAGLASVSKLTPKRAAALRKLLRQELGTDLERWQAYLHALVEDPFRTGNGPRGWRADFDWAVKADNLVKVREAQGAGGGGRA